MRKYNYYECHIKNHEKLGKTVVRATNPAEAKAIFCMLEKLPDKSLIVVNMVPRKSKK